MLPSCTRNPMVDDVNNGEVHPSHLYLDIVEHKLDTDDYHTLRKDEFTSQMNPLTDLDSLGEPKFEVVAPIFGVPADAAKQGVVDRLNKTLGKGDYSYAEALRRVADFNANQRRDGFMATAMKNGDKYTIQVVDDTPMNRDALEKSIEDLELFDSLVTQIREVGGKVDFITEGPSRYNASNAQTLAAGVKVLVSINTAGNITRDLAHEGGHVAVGVLGNSPLIERLSRLLANSPEIVDNILKESGVFNSSKLIRIREAMGELVGDAILDKVHKQSPIGRVVSKILSAATQLFKYISGNKIDAMKIRAERLASNIAYAFMNMKDSRELLNITPKSETLYHHNRSGESYAYTKINALLHSLIKDLKNMGAYSTMKVIKDLDKSIELDDPIYGSRERILAIDGAIARSLAATGIVHCLELILSWVSPSGLLNNLLLDVYINPQIEFETVRVGWANRIRLASLLLSTIGEMQSIIEASTINMNADNKRKVSLAWDALSELTRKPIEDLLTLKVNFVLKTIETTMGKKYVETASKIYREKTEKFWRSWWKNLRPETKKIAIKDLLEEQQRDISLIDTFVRSMSNNPELIGLWADILVKRKNAHANKKTLDYFNRLMELKTEFAEFGIKDTSLLFHRWSTTDESLGITKGELSGYLLGPTDYALFEKKFNKFKKDLWEQFKQDNPHWGEWSDTVRGAKWYEYSYDSIKEWKQNNGIYNQATKEWVPNASYTDSNYMQLIASNPRLAQWYQKYIALKKELDSYLTKGATKTFRAPQFRGIFVNKIKNRHGFLGLFQAGKRAIAAELSDTVLENADDRDFGNDRTYDPEDPMGDYNNACVAIDFARRLPIYGVNLMLNMSNLSTDLFHTTLAYAHMACRYEALKSIDDLMEITRQVLYSKSPGANTYRRKLGMVPSNLSAYRFSRYIDKELYSLLETRHVIKGQKLSFSWNKMFRTLSSLSSKAYMGFNVLGGVTNTGTGFIELHKEAAVGEFYNKADAKWADSWYAKHWAENFAQTGIKGKDDTISLYNRYFNIRNDNEMEFAQFKTMHSRAYNILDSSVMATYSTGDHYMQIVPFMSILHNTIIYDKFGNKIRATDAYKIKERNETASGRRELVLKDKYYVSEDAIKEDAMIEEIASKIRAVPASLTIATNDPSINLTQEELNYLDSLGTLTSPTMNTLQVLSSRLSKLIWNTEAEANLKIKAQEVSIRLHGIYNNIDKTALQQSWYGRMLLCMRLWVLGMGERRFGGKHYSWALGKDVEGNLQTSAKVLLLTLNKFWGDEKDDTSKWDLTLLLLLPYGKWKDGKDVWELGEELGLTKNEIANLRRTSSDVMAILFLFAVAPLLFSFWGPIDEDERPIEALMYYWVNRWRYEQEAISTPLGLVRESTNVFNLFPTGLSYLWDMICTLGVLAGTPFADKSNSTFYYQSKKKGYYKKGDMKGPRRLMRNLPLPWKSYEGLTHPETAWKSFEYAQSKFGGR